MKRVHFIAGSPSAAHHVRMNSYLSTKTFVDGVVTICGRREIMMSGLQAPTYQLFTQFDAREPGYAWHPPEVHSSTAKKTSSISLSSPSPPSSPSLGPPPGAGSTAFTS